MITPIKKHRLHRFPPQCMADSPSIVAKKQHQNHICAIFFKSLPAAGRCVIKLLLGFSAITIINKVTLFAQDQEEVRDPFLSLGDKIILFRKVEDFSKLPYPIVVNGIIWTEEIPVAMLNNEIVQQGQDWRDFKVEKIERDKVILKWRGNLFEVPLEEKEDNAESKD